MSSFDRANRPAGKSTLIIVSCCVVVIAFLVLGTGVLQMGLVPSLKMPDRAEWTQAHFLAKSGSDAFIYWLVENPEQLSDAELDQRLATMLATNGGESQSTTLKEVPEGHFIVKLSQSQDSLVVRCEGVFRSARKTVEVTLSKLTTFATVPGTVTIV